CTAKPISLRKVRRRQPQPSSARSASTTPASLSSIGTTTVAATYLSRKPTPMNRITRPSLATGFPVSSQPLAAISHCGGGDAGGLGVRGPSWPASVSGSGGADVRTATVARTGSTGQSDGAATVGAVSGCGGGSG